jgi:GR25 family glycosyltransferase involved in LPS biosynthesis
MAELSQRSVDMIYTGHCFEDCRAISNTTSAEISLGGDVNLFRSRSAVCTHYYLVSYRGAKRLLDITKNLYNAVDNMMQDAFKGIPSHCSAYMAETGCAWTADWSCPGQPSGNSGTAGADGSTGFACCCEASLWNLSQADGNYGAGAVKSLSSCPALAHQPWQSPNEFKEIFLPKLAHEAVKVTDNQPGNMHQSALQGSHDIVREDQIAQIAMQGQSRHKFLQPALQYGAQDSGTVWWIVPFFFMLMAVRKAACLGMVSMC